MDFRLPLDDLPLLLAGLGYAELPWYGNLLIAVWLWCFGANVGSFMNVVIFRLPAGRSVVTPRSRCPGCGQAIRWFDNVPILSWLWLRARCRNCAVPISARYPLVEATVAVLFVTLAFLGPTTLGRHLPEVLIVPPLRLHSMESLWLMYAYHLLLLCTLICMTLIRYDRRPVPARLFYPALVVGFLAPLFAPQLRPVAFAAPVQLGERWIAVLDGLVGASVGASLAIARVAVWRHREFGQQVWPEIVAAALVGLFLGWQPAACTVVIAQVVKCLTLRASHQGTTVGRFPWVGHLALAAVGYIVFWRFLDDAAPWLGSQATIAAYSLAFLATALVAWFSLPVTTTVSSSTAELLEESKGNQNMSTPADADARTRAILSSSSYRLAELDTEFLAREELRPVRLQLELLKPETILAEQGVHSTIVAFGGTQIVEQREAEERLERARSALAQAPGDPTRERAVQRAERVMAKAKYYDAAREFSRLVSSTCQLDGKCDFVIVTGGGPGIMEAANRGAYEVGAKSIGLNITLPEEQAPNQYISPELCFQFHYFALRKMHFLFRAKALVVFPGGFGTLDELFDALTLRQTRRMQEIPIILYGKEYWDRVVDFQFLADEGTIRDEHLELIHYAETPQEAWDVIASFHGVPQDP